MNEMMIPEPKYRGLAQLDNGQKWIYGYFYRILGNAFICQGEPVNGNLVQVVDPATVTSFVYRTDKNGKEVYIGDILRFEYEGEVSLYEVRFDLEKKIAIIVWLENPTIEWDELPSVKDFSKDFEVIGNRFENPGLLTGNPHDCLKGEPCDHAGVGCDACEWNPNVGEEV